MAGKVSRRDTARAQADVSYRLGSDGRAAAPLSQNLSQERPLT